MAKARADESEGQKVALEDHIQTLKVSKIFKYIVVNIVTIVLRIIKADVSTFKSMVHCTYSTYMIMAVQSLCTLPVKRKCISETD